MTSISTSASPSGQEYFSVVPSDIDCVEKELTYVTTMGNGEIATFTICETYAWHHIVIDYPLDVEVEHFDYDIGKYPSPDIEQRATIEYSFDEIISEQERNHLIQKWESSSEPADFTEDGYTRTEGRVSLYGPFVIKSVTQVSSL